MWTKMKIAAGTLATAFALLPGCADVAQDDQLGDMESEAEVLQEIRSALSGPYQAFNMHTATALPSTDSDWEFEVASNGDIFAILKRGGFSHMTELHVLSAASGYTKFSQHQPTAWGPSGSNVDFLVAKNRDLYAIAKNGTGTGTTEVHVLTARSGYKSFLLQTGTALRETDDNWEFELAGNNDVIAINKVGFGGFMQLLALGKSYNYQQFVQHSQLPLPSGNATFALDPISRDLYAFLRSATGTHSTEVHVMGYDRLNTVFTMQTGTVLGETDPSVDFLLMPNLDVAAVFRSNTGSGKTEVQGRA
jgi:hypothetical protein